MKTFVQRDSERGTPRDARKRTPSSYLVAVVLHAGLAIALWHTLQFPTQLRDFLGLGEPTAQPSERIRFVAVAPPAGGGADVVGPVRTGGGRREPNAATAPVRPSPPPIAPRDVPSVLPPVSAPSAPLGPSSGPFVGAGNGPARGVQPAYSDPRVWPATPSAEGVVKAPDERLDSAVVARLNTYRDSVAINTYQPNKFEKGDWTVGGPGGKYGIDRQFIRLGKFSIPTALLGLLPLNQQANPIAMEREQRLAAMRNEILYNANRQLNEDEFRNAVKAIRARKEKERKEQQAKPPERPVVMPAGDRD